MTAAVRTGRNGQLAKIHATAKKLGMDDDARALLQFNLTGKSSAADMTWPERKRVIEELVRRLNQAPDPDRPRDFDDPVRGPFYRKIDALLHAKGRRWAYVTGRMVAIMCKVDRIEWASLEGLSKIIAALNAERLRERRRKAGK